jgi:hypothetical protein
MDWLDKLSQRGLKPEIDKVAAEQAAKEAKARAAQAVQQKTFVPSKISRVRALRK